MSSIEIYGKSGKDFDNNLRHFALHWKYNCSRNKIKYAGERSSDNYNANKTLRYSLLKRLLKLTFFVDLVLSSCLSSSGVTTPFIQQFRHMNTIRGISTAININTPADIPTISSMLFVSFSGSVQNKIKCYYCPCNIRLVRIPIEHNERNYNCYGIAMVYISNKNN